jgi:hypothetical protein
VTPTNPSLAAPRRTLEPTHACIRCGREGVPADAGLCELCNPLELSQPSATQMHGIAVAGILLFVVVLAVAGRAALAGTGPFTGQVSAVIPTADGLAVSIVVANEGTRAAATTCRLTESPRRMGGASQVVQAPLVPPGSTIEFTTVSTRFGNVPVALVIDCQSP